MKNRYCFITLLAAIATMAACAGRTDVLVLDDRLAAVEGQLEREKARIQQYGQVVESKEQTLRSQSAGLRVEIESMRQQIGQLNGRIEEIEFLVKQDKQALEEAGKTRGSDLEQIKSDLLQIDNRIARVEQYLDLGSAAKPVMPKTTAAPPPSTPSPKEGLTEETLYNKAKAAFDAGNLDVAREGFQELIDRYPNSKNADNAQFWIGEIYYREKWYEKAIVEYQKVVEKYPNGNKVKSALLKQGYAFLNIGDKSNARIILKELISKYPDSNEAQIANRKLGQIN